MSDIRFNRWLHQSGTGGVFQDSSGNVGVGTSVPRSALDIVGVINVTGNINSTGVTTVTSLRIGTGTSISSPASNTLTLGTNNVESVRITSSADVGIGTNSPTSARLHVFGGSGLTVERQTGNTIAYFKNTGSTTPNIAFQASGTTNTPYIGVNNDDLLFGTGSSGLERVRITSSGGIGIGTTTTNSRLLSITGAGNAGTQVEIRGSSDAAGIAMFSARQFEIQSTASNEANYPSSFVIYDRNANGYRMSIDGSGRLQIPSQPGFCASGTAGAANQPSTGDSAMLGTLFNTTSHTGGFNTGSHYSTGTGIFTAPVSGKYYTFFNMRWETANFVQNSYIRIYISKNNIDTLIIHQINGQNEAWANYMAMSCSGIIDLAAGDTLRPKGGLNGGTAVGWWNESSWGAWLLG